MFCEPEREGQSLALYIDPSLPILTALTPLPSCSLYGPGARGIPKRRPGMQRASLSRNYSPQHAPRSPALRFARAQTGRCALTGSQPGARPAEVAARQVSGVRVSPRGGLSAVPWVEAAGSGGGLRERRRVPPRSGAAGCCGVCSHGDPGRA